jgi:two-component system, NarL family, sensor histidine kinase UhpB
MNVPKFPSPVVPPPSALDDAAVFSAVAGHLQQFVWVVDPDGFVRRYFGPQWSATGQGEAHPVKNLLDSIYPDDAPLVRRWLERLAGAPAGARVADAEFRAMRPDGGWSHVRARGTNLLSDPRVVGLLIEEHDDAALKHAEVTADRVLDRLRLATQNVKLGFFEFDVPNGLMKLSEEYFKVRGIEVPESAVVDASVPLAWIHPDDRAAVRNERERVARGPANDFDVEYRLSTGAGDWMWVHAQGAAIGRDLAGRAIKISGIVLDIDRRKRAERGLARSEAHYRAVIAMTPGFIHESIPSADGRFKFRWASDGLPRVLGWTVEEINERGGWAAIVHPDLRQMADERRQAVMQGKPTRMELRLMAKSGQWLWFDASSFPYEDPDTGAVVALMGTLYDITPQKQAAELVRLGEERFRLATEAVSSIVYERTESTGMVTCASGLSVLGLNDADRVRHGDWWLKQVHPEDRAAFRDANTAARQTTVAVESRYRLRHVQGHYVDVIDRFVAVRNDAGVIERVVGCAVDVSADRRREQLLREAESLAHVGSWELDVADRTLMFSDGAFRVLGMERAAYVPTLESLYEFLALDSAPVLSAAIERAIATGEGYDVNVEIFRATGEQRWVNMVGRVEMADGRPARLYGALHDIDDLTRNNMRYRRQSDLLRLSMDAAKLISWDWNPRNDRLHIEYRSQAFQPEVDLVSSFEGALQQVFVEDRARVVQYLRDAINQGEAATFDYRVIADDGRLMWWRTAIIRATHEAEAIVIGATRDVTDEVAAEAAVRRHAHMLRSMAENSPDVVALISPDLRIEFVNRAIVGRTPEELVGHSILEVATADTTIDVEAVLRGVVATGVPTHFETSHRLDSGRQVIVENRVGPVRDGDKIAGAVIYVTDVTERRALEREILDISDREQRRIGGDLHDGLGQELTGIALMVRGIAGGVARGVLPEEAALNEVIAIVNGAIETTRNIARGLSPIAFEGGGFVNALRTLVVRSRKMYGLNIKFRSRLVSNLDFDSTTSGHLYRIVQEALTNTARHARATSVLVQLTVRAGRVTLSITDDGIGLSADGSSGMGLKIMRYRAHMVGAELIIEPGVGGRGTRVACQLLLAESAFVAGLTDRESAVSGEHTRGATSRA